MADTQDIKNKLGRIRAAIERVHNVASQEIERDNQLRDIQIRAMQIYFDAAAAKLLPAWIDPPKDRVVTAIDWKRLAKHPDIAEECGHPDKIAAGKKIGDDGAELYLYKPGQFPRWIEHAIRVVDFLVDQLPTRGRVQAPSDRKKKQVWTDAQLIEKIIPLKKNEPKLTASAAAKKAGFKSHTTVTRRLNTQNPFTKAWMAEEAAAVEEDNLRDAAKERRFRRF